MSILILFQSFKVVDEILHHGEGEIKKGYIIIEEVESETELTQKPEQMVEEINFKDLFSNASLENGKKISKQCVACHSFDNSLKIKVGPPLWNIVNRKAASIEGFKYSEALVNFKKNWSKEEIYYFLEKPKEYIKGTKMIYKGLKKSVDRADLITYLESLK